MTDHRRKTLTPIPPPDPSQDTPWPDVHPGAPKPGTYREEAVRAAGGLARDAYQDWRSERRRRPREARPPASTTAIVALVLAVLLPVALATWHQLGANDFDEKAQSRHEALMRELRAQSKALYGLTDVVAEHHPEAAKVGTQLSRDVAHGGTVPGP